VLRLELMVATGENRHTVVCTYGVVSWHSARYAVKRWQWRRQMEGAAKLGIQVSKSTASEWV